MWPFKKKSKENLTTKHADYFDGYRYFIIEYNYKIYIERRGWVNNCFLGYGWEQWKCPVGKNYENTMHDSGDENTLYFNSVEDAIALLKETNCFEKYGTKKETQYP